MKSKKQTTPKIPQDDDKIGPYDILYGRTSNAYNNIGNRRFRVTIRMFLQRYQELDTRADRKEFIFYLTRLFRNEIGFRFVKKDGDDYHDIGEVEARKKIGHALLDQTVKHQKEAPSVPSISMISSTSKRLSAVKKAQHTKKTQPSSTSSLSDAQTLAPRNVRRVSLTSSSLSSSNRQGDTVHSGPTIQVLKEVVSIPNAKDATSLKQAGGKGVSKLESEICLLLLGLQNQDNPKQQLNPPSIGPAVTTATAAASVPTRGQDYSQ